MNEMELTHSLKPTLKDDEKIVNVKIHQKKPHVYVLTRDSDNTRRGYQSKDGGKSYNHAVTILSTETSNGRQTDFTWHKGAD